MLQVQAKDLDISVAGATNLALSQDLMLFRAVNITRNLSLGCRSVNSS